MPATVICAQYRLLHWMLHWVQCWVHCWVQCWVQSPPTGPPKWIEELISGDYVMKIQNFSKFLHGTAKLHRERTKKVREPRIHLPYLMRRCTEPYRTPSPDRLQMFVICFFLNVLFDGSGCHRGLAWASGAVVVLSSYQPATDPNCYPVTNAAEAAGTSRAEKNR